MNAAAMGVLLSAFSWSYSVAQIPAGMLIDRWGFARVYALGFALWAGATVLTGAVSTGLGIAVAEGVGSPVAPAELKSVRHFRQAWKRLNAEQRLAQSRAALPQNAGPLNSQHLLHKALQQMRQLSPIKFP